MPPRSPTLPRSRHLSQCKTDSSNTGIILSCFQGDFSADAGRLAFIVPFYFRVFQKSTQVFRNCAVKGIVLGSGDRGNTEAGLSQRRPHAVLCRHSGNSPFAHPVHRSMRQPCIACGPYDKATLRGIVEVWLELVMADQDVKEERE